MAREEQYVGGVQHGLEAIIHTFGCNLKLVYKKSNAATVHNRPTGTAFQLGTLIVSNDMKKQVSAKHHLLRGGQKAAWWSCAKQEGIQRDLNLSFPSLSETFIASAVLKTGWVFFPTLSTGIKHVKHSGHCLKWTLPHLRWPPESHGLPASNQTVAPETQETIEKPCSP